MHFSKVPTFRSKVTMKTLELLYELLVHLEHLLHIFLIKRWVNETNYIEVLGSTNDTICIMWILQSTIVYILVVLYRISPPNTSCADCTGQYKVWSEWLTTLFLVLVIMFMYLLVCWSHHHLQIIVKIDMLSVCCWLTFVLFSDGEALLCSLISKTILHTYHFHSYIHAIKFSPDGKYVVWLLHMCYCE